MLDKIDAYQHEKELEVQEKLKASERKLEKAKKAGASAAAVPTPPPNSMRIPPGAAKTRRNTVRRQAGSSVGAC